MSFMGAFGANMLNVLGENSSNLWGTGAKLKERERKDALWDYQQQERLGIQARVEGAKAAGLHPLAALGYQAGPGASIPVGGSNVKPIQPSHEPVVDEEMRQANLRLLDAQAAEANARAASSLKALATQPGNAPATSAVGSTLPTERENRGPGGKTLAGIKVVPNEIQASRDGKTIGVHPGQTDIKDPMLGTVTGMSDAMLKQTEDMETARSIYFIMANKDRLLNWLYGKTGLDDASFKAALSRQKQAEKREVDRETIRLMNRDRARRGR